MGEGRERGRTSQLDPSDKAFGRAQPPSPNAVKHSWRGRCLSPSRNCLFFQSFLMSLRSQRHARSQKRYTESPKPPIFMQRKSMRRHGAKNADYRGGVTCVYDTQLPGACLHPSPVAALALRPSGACQTYQSPPQPPGPILFGTEFARRAWKCPEGVSFSVA